VNRSSANALTDAALAQFIGERLRGYYKALQEEPLPEKLIAMVEGREARQRGRAANAAAARKASSSKQLPTNQSDTDNAKKREPNEIHPEDYGMCLMYDQSIAASTKRPVAKH